MCILPTVLRTIFLLTFSKPSQNQFRPFKITSKPVSALTEPALAKPALSRSQPSPGASPRRASALGASPHGARPPKPPQNQSLPSRSQLSRSQLSPDASSRPHILGEGGGGGGGYTIQYIIRHTSYGIILSNVICYIDTSLSLSPYIYIYI